MPPDPPRAAALAQLLRAHAPADAAEAAHREAMLALCALPGDPFDRRRFAPGHFTASAFVLSPNGASLLLIWHRKLGRWLQPGGHFEPADADVDAAARRELAEEAGLTALTRLGAGLLDLDVHEIPARGPDPRHRHFDLRLLYRALDTGLAPGSDAGAARWVGLAGIDAPETDESVLRALRKLRALGPPGPWGRAAAP